MTQTQEEAPLTYQVRLDVPGRPAHVRGWYLTRTQAKSALTRMTNSNPGLRFAIRPVNMPRPKIKRRQ